MNARPIPSDDRRDERPADLDLGPREGRARRMSRKELVEARLIPDEYGRLMTMAAISLLRERIAEAKSESSKIVA